jgi:hypothetical protein
LEALNPAQKLKDGQKIIVPYREQRPRLFKRKLIAGAEAGGANAGASGTALNPIAR